MLKFCLVAIIAIVNITQGNEYCQYKVPDLKQWLNENKLTGMYVPLNKLGFETLDSIMILNSNEIDTLIGLLNLSLAYKGKFKSSIHRERRNYAECLDVNIDGDTTKSPNKQVSSADLVKDIERLTKIIEHINTAEENLETYKPVLKDLIKKIFGTTLGLIYNYIDIIFDEVNANLKLQTKLLGKQIEKTKNVNENDVNKIMEMILENKSLFTSLNSGLLISITSSFDKIVAEMGKNKLPETIGDDMAKLFDEAFGNAFEWIYTYLNIYKGKPQSLLDIYMMIYEMLGFGSVFL